eukprot:CAMPEP_0174726562 /NCGR_PEP_ID=MMETSP1094-20130205/48060_1 /TAXON_ID=156173 /ORGANISM="Chrysochromulina brevifilum, Strain UTEX LB 985" /LENGTH=177 /DNA_ID=CAMNT_0015928161 /DNA_START=41 /DNA_END=571 /DNA_ORIENTATION=+
MTVSLSDLHSLGSPSEHNSTLDWWQTQCETWPFGERLFFVAFASALHVLVLYASCGIFSLAKSYGMWSKCLLPRERPDLRPKTQATVELNRRAAREQTVGAFVVTPVLLYVTYPVISQLIIVCGAAPPSAVWARDLVVMIAGCDFIFYWIHRTCHASAWLYKHVHKQHHEFKATTVW